MKGSTDHFEGEHVRLVPATLASFDELYEIAVCSGAGTTWRNRGLIPSPERFASLVLGELSFAMVSKRTGNVFGYIGIDQLDSFSAVGEMSAFVDLRSHARLMAGFGVELFLRYVFSGAGLRKVVVHSPHKETGAMGRLLDRLPGVELEGVQREHVRLGQELVDLGCYAIWADKFMSSSAAELVETVELATTEFRTLVAIIASAAPLPVDEGAIDGGSMLVEDCGIDSLAMVELIEAAESAYGRRWDDDSGLEYVTTVQDLVEFLRLR